MKKSKILLFFVTIILICSIAMILSACNLFNNDDNNHTHTYATEWTYDDEYHWHQADCGHSDLYTDKEEHSFTGGKCSKCKFDADSSKTYKTITFDVNGGDNEIENMRFAVGEVMNNLPLPSRNGYNFVCWVDKYDRYTEYDFSSIMPNEDLTLLAKWEIKLASYEDDYISFKPATSGYKDMDIYYQYQKDVDKFVYVEITSDNLSGRPGQENNFNLRNIDGMAYKIKPGYTWAWYQGSFDTPNGAQRFTLNYGSNVQFITISDSSGIVLYTYLLDIYVRHDYYMNLYTDIFADEPYDRIRVIENDRFSADTATKDIGFEFDSRVYFNEKTGKYEKFVYSTPITKSWNLYQTYNDMEIEADLAGGTLEGNLSIKPYTKYFTLPSPQKDGYDFLGWQLPDGKYLTNVQGFSGINYLSEENCPDKLVASYIEKKYYYSFDGNELRTIKTIPVVTYTDYTMTEILDVLYNPYNTDCVLPIKVPATSDKLFREWQEYYLDSNNNFNENLSMFDFNTKVTKPIALAPRMETSDYYVIPLNQSVTYNKVSTYIMYLPVAKTYSLKITTTGNVKFTIKLREGNTEGSHSYTASNSSPANVSLRCYEYNLGAQETISGYAKMTITSLTGSFTATLQGNTAESNGKPIVTNATNISKIGEEFTVTLSKPGYTFAGWYKGETKVSDNEFLTMDDKENTYTAKWIKVTIDKSILNAGSVTTLNSTYMTGDNVTITATTNSGYTFVGWYNGDTELTKELNYSFTMPSDNVTYTAKWIKVSVVSENTTYGTVSSLTGKYKVSDEVTITATTKAGYTFVGWYNGDTELTKELSYSFTMPSENVTFIAKWSKLMLSTDNVSAGTITTLSDKYVAGQSLTIEAIENLGYEFVGWYCGNVKLTDDLSYTFSMPSVNAEYVAKWDIKEEMNNFVFTSTATSCSITNIKDKNITTIIIPNYVTKIGISAFKNCYNVSSVTIGRNVNSIESQAFYNCFKLIEIYNLSSLEIVAESTSNGYVAYYAKVIYNSLENESCLKLVNDEFIIFNDINNDNLLVSYLGDETNLILPNSVEGGDYGIYKYAFYNNNKLTSIVIPEHVNSIGNNAFYGCTGIEKIKYNATNCIDLDPNNNSFYNAGKNGVGIEVIVGSEVEKIPAYLFYSNSVSYSPKIINVAFSTNSNCQEIGNYAFYNCNAITNIVLTEGLITIGSNAFVDCDIASIHIPSSVNCIGIDAFYNCTKLASVYIDDINAWYNVSFGNEQANPLYIAGSLYVDSNLLALLEVDSSVTKINSFAFVGCTSIKGVYIEDINAWSCISFGNESANPLTLAGALYLNGNLVESVQLSNNVTKISAYAFNGYNKLKSVSIYNSVVEIENNAFAGCNKIEKVYFYGASSDWANIQIGNNNSALTQALRYCCTDPENLDELETIVPDGYVGIYTIDDLKNIQSNGKYILMNDIDCENQVVKISQFNGLLLGNNKILSNIKISSTYTRSGTSNYYTYSYYSGMFYELGEEAVIKELGIDTMIFEYTFPYNISGSYSVYLYMGALVGYNNGSILNCYIKNACFDVTSPEFGGMVGYNGSKGSIINCYCDGYITGNIVLDSITYYYTYSRSGNALTTASSRSSYSATIEVSGICHSNSGLIENVYSNVRININASVKNVIISETGTDAITSTIVDTYYYDVASAIGSGICSSSSGTIKNSFSVGTITTTATFTGTLTGKNSQYKYTKARASIAKNIVYNKTSGSSSNIYYSNSIPVDNDAGIHTSIENLRSKQFCIDTLGWDENDWKFAENEYPMLSWQRN